MYSDFIVGEWQHLTFKVEIKLILIRLGAYSVIPVSLKVVHTGTIAEVLFDEFLVLVG